MATDPAPAQSPRPPGRNRSTTAATAPILPSARPPLAQPWVVAALGGSVLFLVTVLVILVAVTPDAARWMSWSTTTGVVGSFDRANDRTDVVYAFRVDGDTYEGEHDVPGGTDVTVAGPIGVRYDPADPRSSVPTAAFEDQLAFLLGSIVAAAAVSVVVALLLLRWRRRVDGTGRQERAP